MAMVDVLSYLKDTKNTLIGNPTAKVELNRSSDPDGPLLATIVEYLNCNAEGIREADCSEETVTRIRIEAANVVAALANGPREVLLGLMNVNAVTAVLSAVEEMGPDDPQPLKVAVLRTLRALCVALADCAGTSLWGLGDEYLEYRSEARAELDYIFQPQSQALDSILPLLESMSSQVKLVTAQLLGAAVRIPKHRLAVTDWLPPEERAKEYKGKRGWENPALVDATAPSRLGGWVVRHLSGMLTSEEYRLQEAALYAIAALVKDNRDIADILSKPSPENKTQCVLNTAAGLTKDRRTEIRLAACQCAANVLRALPTLHHTHHTHHSYQHHQLCNTVIHVLSSVFSHPYEAPVNRWRACHILTSLVIDNNDLCNEAVNVGVMTKLSDTIKTITPTVVPQEWEDGEAVDIARLREAALTTIAALALHDEGIRDEITRSLCLLPVISVSLKHPQARVRYGACLCVRSLARSVRVLRTSMLDSGVGNLLCDIIDNRDEDKRVQSMALAGLCNLLNDFSPLRKTIMDREDNKMIKRIAELSKGTEADAIRVSAFWSIKNLLNKATVEEKQLIMDTLGWEHLKSALRDPDESVQEQAFNCVVNIASTSPEHIDLLFKNMSGDELMSIFGQVLSTEPINENVQKQAVFALANIANGTTAHLMYIRHNEQVLHGIRNVLSEPRTDSRSDVRRAAASCIDAFSRVHLTPFRMDGIEDHP